MSVAPPQDDIVDDAANDVGEDAVVMPNGNRMFDPEARYAAVEERVANQAQRLAQVEATMTREFANITSKLDTFSSEYKNNQRPQWQAMGVLLAAALAIGTLAYWPIRETQTDIKSQIHDIMADDMSVGAFAEFKNTYESNRALSRQDNDAKFAAVNANIAGLNAQLVPRGEHEEKWRANDQRFLDLQRQISDNTGNLQRQIDEQAKRYGDTFSLKDSYSEMRSTVAKLQDELAFLRSGGMVKQ